MKKIVFYTPSASGIGHKRRINRLAVGLLQSGLNPFVIYGGNIPEGFLDNDDYGYLCLPQMVFDRTNDYLQDHGYLTLYTNIIRSCLSSLHPNIFVFTHHNGINGELEPLFKETRLWKQTLKILVWRDVLESHSEVTKWIENPNMHFIETLRNYVDIICVMGDSRVFDYSREYKLPPDISSKIRYLGYVGPQKLTHLTGEMNERCREIVVSFGGGMQRKQIARLTLRSIFIASNLLNLSATVYMGYYWRDEQWLYQIISSLPKANIKIEPFSPKYLGHLASSALAVIAGGYNSVVEALYFNTPMVILDSRGTNDRENEVTTRNRAFEKEGLCRVVRADMNADKIAFLFEEQMKLAPYNLNINGVYNFQSMMYQLLNDNK